jgi:hypothetical protein
MPEENEEEIRNKLLISLYVLQPPLNIPLSGIVLNLKKPLIDINNYFILRNKSWVFHINKTGEKKIIKYNKIHNPEIYRLLKLSYEKNERLYLFNLNNNEINDLFKKITRDRLHCEVKIDNIPSLIANDLINSNINTTGTIGNNSNNNNNNSTNDESNIDLFRKPKREFLDDKWLQIKDNTYNLL